MSNAYRGLTRIAWGYVFLYVNFNLGTLNILPGWVGYLLFFSAIGLLSDKRRDLLLLKPFCILLGAEQLADWLAVLFTGATLMERFFLLQVLLLCVGIYFHFQLLTDLAELAEEVGESGDGLRLCRNVDVVAATLVALPIPWSDLGVLGLATVMILMVLLIIVALCILVQLFGLRKRFV